MISSKKCKRFNSKKDSKYKELQRKQVKSKKNQTLKVVDTIDYSTLTRVECSIVSDNIILYNKVLSPTRNKKILNIKKPFRKKGLIYISDYRLVIRAKALEILSSNNITLSSIEELTSRNILDKLITLFSKNLNISNSISEVECLKRINKHFTLIELKPHS